METAPLQRLLRRPSSEQPSLDHSSAIQASIERSGSSTIYDGCPSEPHLTEQQQIISLLRQLIHGQQQAAQPTCAPPQAQLSITPQERLAPLSHHETRDSPSRFPEPSPPQAMHINIAEPPDHGPWQDLHYLVTTFKDKHSKYAKRCSKGAAVSVWNCYNGTDKESIIKHLNSTPQGRRLHRDEHFMEQLSDADLYALLQNELGLTSEIAVENALSAITFTGNILDRTTWVNFHTAWCQVLKRVTHAGALQPRRMVDLFRNAIPDAFVSTWLKARKFADWNEAYDAAITALTDPQWLVEFSKQQQHLLTKALAQPQRQPQQQQQQQPRHSNQAQLQQPQQPHGPQQQQHSDKPANAAQDKSAAPQQPKKPFVPLEYKNRRNQLNVNPNMKLGLDQNPQKLQCTRCLDTHRYRSELCTTPQKQCRDGQPALTPEEHNSRLQTRWNEGFFFIKQLSEYLSPSPKDAAQQAHDAATKMKK